MREIVEMLNDTENNNNKKIFRIFSHILVKSGAPFFFLWDEDPEKFAHMCICMESKIV